MTAVKRTKALEAMWAVHRLLYRRTSGRLGSNVNGMPVLLLTTKGHRSGLPRTSPLEYVEVEDGFVVVASNAGETRHPAWFFNLRADPKASIQMKNIHLSVEASEVSHDERESLWGRITDADDSYTVYQGRTSREIPLVHLKPTGS